VTTLPPARGAAGHGAAAVAGPAPAPPVRPEFRRQGLPTVTVIPRRRPGRPARPGGGLL